MDLGRTRGLASRAPKRHPGASRQSKTRISAPKKGQNHPHPPGPKKKPYCATLLKTLSFSKQAASLAGVAPHPKQSGQSNGYRRTCGGRQNIKPILFLAAMTAARSKSTLGEFYKRLISNGKKPIVAIVALMRKIIVIANAKLRDLMLEKNTLTT